MDDLTHTDSPLSPSQIAKLRAEHEEALHQCELLRREAVRLAAINRALDGKLRVAEAERDRLGECTHAVEHSKPWRIIQFFRSLVGRKW